ncbi:alanine racemase [Hathewaya histolytica]|uniref:Alanine racemase n=1 Tax=Hathewaya histolytica TaxID=1498 RepID=A0A4U9QYE3_HATHI|nr:alanine racemase [Hathewaya histolytica]VTQ83765.1 alanine racemase [Hathewaya histolytica]
MFKHLRPVWAEVNLDNLIHNIREIRKISKSKEIMAVVKADAYGHGAIGLASVLLENGANSLAVAVLSEAIELRKYGVDCPILILGFTPPSFIDEILKYDIEQTIYSYDFAEELSRVAKIKNKTAKIHIAVDTGMGRIGYLKDEKSIEEVVKISRLPNIKIVGVFSHFSSADEEDKDYTKLQIDRFNWFCEKLINKGVDIGKRHISNSAGIIDLEDQHLEVVRPGIILYGYYPSSEVKKERISLKPVMSLKTNVVHIKKVKAEEYIGYGRVFKTEKDSIIATLPVGYADGYSRLLTGKARVLIKGEVAPVVGKICMDQCMIDVTHIKDIKVGEEVILIGESGNNKITAEEIGELIGTMSYEILCILGKRVPRVYIKEGKVVQIRNYI